MIRDFFDYVILNRRPRSELDRLIQSPAEQAFWDEAKMIMPELIPQVPVRGYQIDFGLPELKVGFEILGYEYHSSKVDMENDKIRLRRLGLSGWLVWEFMAAEIFANAADCARQAARIAQEVSRWR